MLGVVSAEGQGVSDRLLSTVAARLRDGGLRVVGAVQENTDRPGQRHCDMDLHVLTGTAEVVRISQNLGRAAQGCRIDSDGLERAAGLVAAALGAGADVLIVNKFGKREAEGQGFRPLIGQALAAGIPVLTSVKAGNQAAFDAFADGLSEPVEATESAIVAWVMAALGRDGPNSAASAAPDPQGRRA